MTFPARWKETKDIAKQLNTRLGWVGKWRRRFATNRLKGLIDASRCKYAKEMEMKV